MGYQEQNDKLNKINVKNIEKIKLLETELIAKAEQYRHVLEQSKQFEKKHMNNTK